MNAFSEALGINARGQIVGVSCADLCQAVLWQDGKMYKLSDLVPGFTDLLNPMQPGPALAFRLGRYCPSYLTTCDATTWPLRIVTYVT